MKSAMFISQYQLTFSYMLTLISICMLCTTAISENLLFSAITIFLMSKNSAQAVFRPPSRGTIPRLSGRSVPFSKRWPMQIVPASRHCGLGSRVVRHLFGVADIGDFSKSLRFARQKCGTADQSILSLSVGLKRGLLLQGMPEEHLIPNSSCQMPASPRDLHSWTLWQR